MVISNEIKIDLSSINSWDDFHNHFIENYNFPNYYGRNMDAWIDVMDEYYTGLSLILIKNPGYTFSSDRNPYLSALLDCTAFINYRRRTDKERSYFIVSFSD